MHVHLCRHCQKLPARRPRRLCWLCYKSAAVRERYPSTSKYARKGAGLCPRARPRPPTPTDALPGSDEKIAVLEERARLGLQLWHPKDAGLDHRPRRRLRRRAPRATGAASLIAG